MSEITPEQREAALRAMEIEEGKYVIFGNLGLRQTHLEALIAAGWGPVTDAEARGYRAGVEDAGNEVAKEIDRARTFGAHHVPVLAGVAAAIRALADKPEEDRITEMLREAGCKCAKPLIGHRPNVGPRCRLCNTVAPDKPKETPHG